MKKIPPLTEWANAVKARDGKCQHCGTTEDLHAHHIKHKAAYPELALVVENGMALCYRCHKIEHEKKRPPRIRSIRPQRKTLNSEIERLREQVAELTSQNKKMRFLIAECTRGVCQSSVKRRKIMASIPNATI